VLVILVVSITDNQSYTNNYKKDSMHKELYIDDNLQSKIEDARQMVSDGVPVSVVLKMTGLRLVDLGL